MTTKNDVTGDLIKSDFNSPEFIKNYDGIFKKELDNRTKEMLKYFIDGTEADFTELIEGGYVNRFPDGSMALSSKGRKFV